ncbi:RecQ family ATP-dependent DNA helicase [Coleofasciculus sp. F4-SAH-05]|uniref:RecQ family ATP-dependent DNA helicase n=1 Tax=Coleofasciculus sp. F4-SAH-05 TaxID=3069525 RepID=UPI0032FE3699
MTTQLKAQALSLLRQALKNPTAQFRDGQWEAIASIILERSRLLVVQRTGWGKSIVYFLATRLLRDNHGGPTLLISPLLALMRNQIVAAERININAATINSSNPEEWEQINAQLQAGIIDILLISPERLANEDFRQTILLPISQRIGLFVVDEAHCISDWGHDFRPDYRRIVRVLQALPQTIPALATTATANNRVVNDIITQLGANLLISRGTLTRKSLQLQTLKLPSSAARMAWLAEHLPNLPGSGIIYALTTKDTERVADWLNQQGIHAQAYHAKLTHEQRLTLEDQLLNNEIKALVATTALGMGFDKPDLGFVIHYQRPGSVVHYYQQVGRLSLWGDAGWGELVKQGKYHNHDFDDALVQGAFEMIQRWHPQPFPTWVTCVPSLHHPQLVPNFAQRLAHQLQLPFQPIVQKVRHTQPQKQMGNSYQQAHNLDGVFAVNSWQGMKGAVFLIDDMVDSRWTFTVIAALLRRAGSGPVFPLALALNSLR